MISGGGTVVPPSPPTYSLGPNSPTEIVELPLPWTVRGQSMESVASSPYIPGVTARAEQEASPDAMDT